VLLGLDSVPQPDDAADAIAVAICHIHSARMKSLARRAKEIER
jgi:crossover junction endodeoxyribonuclease RuvC